MADNGVRPMILVRGFGGPDVTDEQRSPYQGFNEGTAYPGKRGENYIYEGFILRALKSDRYPYTDATNVVGYYDRDVEVRSSSGPGGPPSAGSIVIDPFIAERVLRRGTAGTIWVYRYYDLTPRALARYGEGLVKLIDIVEAAAVERNEGFRGVDIVAHSMGGLVVRAALGLLHERENGSAPGKVHRIVTLGTPHRGIAFQRAPRWLLDRLPAVRKAKDEVAAFDPADTSFRKVADWFPLSRLLTVVGTDYRSYGNSAASALNRFSSLLDEGTLATNRSDGLVKQSSAQLPGAPRTFVHKCHGGADSLVTSREAYEIAMRFFHGSHRVRLWLDTAEIRRGGDWIGDSEFYFGVSIKPRYVDFDLFHQSTEAENCYGPFRDRDLGDELGDLAVELSEPLAAAGDRTTTWAGPDRLIWEGCLDVDAKPGDTTDNALVFRLDVYVGERDNRGFRSSDDVIFRKQYFVQVVPGEDAELYVHTDQQYLTGRQPVTRAELQGMALTEVTAQVQRAERIPGGWTFMVGGTGFAATLRVGFEGVDPSL